MSAKLSKSDRYDMFYNALKMAQIQNDVLHLPNDVTFLSKESLPSKLYVRTAYKDLHSLIHDACPWSNVLVIGNPGIGKSFFALYELYLLLQNGGATTIVYECLPLDIFMMLTAQDLLYAGERLSRHHCEVEELLENSETYYLFDAGTRRNMFPYIVNAKTIVFVFYTG